MRLGWSMLIGFLAVDTALDNHSRTLVRHMNIRLV